jgi:hypothetical protein
MSRDVSGILVTSLDYRFTTKALPVSVAVSPSTDLVGYRRNHQHCRLIHGAHVVGLAESAAIGAFTVAVALADLLVSATLVALTVTV